MILNSRFFWSKFRMIRRYWAFRPGEIRRFYGMLDRASEGSVGHRPIQLLIHSAAILDWIWDTGLQAWIRTGLPELHILAGPVQQFQGALFDAWGNVSRDLSAKGKSSVVALCWTFMPLSTSSFLR